MKITENKGRAQVFTLKDGKTLRILARTSAEVKDSKISEEILIAEQMGLVVLSPTTKKSGGSK